MKHEISLFIDETGTTQDEEITASIFTERDLVTYPDGIQKETVRRVRIIKWMNKRLIGGWTEKNLKPLISAAKEDLTINIPSARTLASWWRLYFNSGYQLTSLIPMHHTKGNTSKRLSDSDEIFFERAIDRYLVKEKPSIAHVYQYYCDSIRIENKSLVSGTVKKLSERAFYKRIDEMPKYDVMVARYGKYRADIEFNAIDGHLPPQRVLERVEIDHTPLDLILIDDELLVPIGRPYLTLLIDSFSKCIVGFYFGFKGPSYESTRKALMNALMPKDYIKQKYPEIVNDWPCRGKMEQLVVDNGPEFWCDSLEQACLEIGINVQYNPIKKPWLKPLVERFFGTLNKKFLINIPGKTFSNIMERYDYDPAKDAVLRFSTFNMLFHKWIIDVYHQDHDSRKRFIPAQSWEMGLDNFPPVEYIPHEMAQIEIVMGIKANRIHRRGGINIHCLRYDSDELALYRKSNQTIRNGKDKIIIKTNPDDISFINVYLEEIQQYLKVPCIDPIGYTKGLSLLRHQINLRLHRDFISREVDLDGLAQARMFIHNKIELEMDDIKSMSSKKSIKGMSKLAKYNGVASDGTGTVVPDKLPLFDLKEPNKPEQSIPNNDDWDDLVSDLEAY